MDAGLKVELRRVVSGIVSRMAPAAVVAASLIVYPMFAPTISRADSGSSAPAAQADSQSSMDNSRSLDSRPIAKGTPVKVKLLDDVSSESAQVGEMLRAVVSSSDSSGLPAGTVFVGKITGVRPATPKTGGSLNIQFCLPNGSYDAQRSTSDSYHGPMSDDASVYLTGRDAKGPGHVTGAAAAAGAVVGLLSRGNLGGLLAGGAIGAVGGVAVDQSQKRSASDVNLKKGSEISVKLDRSMALRTIVIPDVGS